MSEFNRMTIVAAAEVVSCFHSHPEMEVLEVQWGLVGRINSCSKSARVASFAKIATEEAPVVMTENGNVCLGRALVETAIKAPQHWHESPPWKKFIAGLRFDGFEIVVTELESAPANSWERVTPKTEPKLLRMLPKDVPGLDFREAESEIVTLLDRDGFSVAKGHLNQAMSAFQRGEWASAKGRFAISMKAISMRLLVVLATPEAETVRQSATFSAHFSRHFIWRTTTSGMPTIRSRNTFRD